MGSEPKPILDNDGVPQCNYLCQWYVSECNNGRRIEYCSHADAGDPNDDCCRPVVLGYIRRLRSWGPVVRAQCEMWLSDHAEDCPMRDLVRAIPKEHRPKQKGTK